MFLDAFQNLTRFGIRNPLTGGMDHTDAITRAGILFAGGHAYGWTRSKDNMTRILGQTLTTFLHEVNGIGKQGFLTQCFQFFIDAILARGGGSHEVQVQVLDCFNSNRLELGLDNSHPAFDTHIFGHIARHQDLGPILDRFDSYCRIILNWRSLCLAPSRSGVGQFGSCMRLMMDLSMPQLCRSDRFEQFGNIVPIRRCKGRTARRIASGTIANNISRNDHAQICHLTPAM
mmetsp:Transcript_17536/g.36322  ORF Transcript_17536/g.36322 Transcript_17536/m.36322 type:complete len:231 (+) Transcript_17536:490-1182(+)